MTAPVSEQPIAEAAVRERLTIAPTWPRCSRPSSTIVEARRRERRIVEARFPRLKRLAEFDLGAAPSIEPAPWPPLERGAWIDAGTPVVLLGDSGTAKSHLPDPRNLARYRETACQLTNQAVSPSGTLAAPVG